MAIDALSSLFAVVAFLGCRPRNADIVPGSGDRRQPRLDGGRPRATLEAVTSICEESPR